MCTEGPPRIEDAPQTPSRPRLPSAPGTLPPQTPSLPSRGLPSGPLRVPSTPGSLPLQAPWRPNLPTETPFKFRPRLPGAPGCLAPQAAWRPKHPGATLLSAPGSLPPQAPFRPILPSAPYSIPPHAPSGFRLRLRRCLPSAPACPACMCARVGCQRILTGRSQVWRRGECQLAYIDARCMRSCASAPRLICCRVAGWHVVALVCAFDSANSERPRAGARANSLST